MLTQIQEKPEFTKSNPLNLKSQFRRFSICLLSAGVLIPCSLALSAGDSAHRPSSPSHWAFQPIRSSQPLPRPDDWAQNPIDQFIQAKHHQLNLQPVRPASKQILARRVFFDLIGLPPDPSQLASFLQDQSPDGWPRLVDQLLASPRYGERWARHWMDLVRYSDTAGDNADYPIPESRLYRDYIIDSFNQDKPYPQFVKEQLAGDLLPQDSASSHTSSFAEHISATGFLALSRRYATAPFELWHLTLEDSIETTGRAFLGLTLRCARCHDHKYDPVSKEDYYALYGIFASTRYPYAGSEEFQSKKFPRSGFVPLLAPAAAAPRFQSYQQTLRALETEIQQIENSDPLALQIESIKQQEQSAIANPQPVSSSVSTPTTAGQLKSQRETLQKQLAEKLAPLRARLAQLQRPGTPPDLATAYAVWEGAPTNSPLHIRGNPDEPGPVIPRAVPHLPGTPQPNPIPADSSGRLQLADWITHSDHPLTARVMVNRIWQQHFGRGLVATPSNFGLRGDLPSHPELLDFLAARFIASGGSVKSLHRLILTSKTYQLSSEFNSQNAARDPGNRYYWRQQRRRLDAEALRDSMLLISGQLDLSRPASHPFPPIHTWAFTQHSPFKAVYESNHRSVYLMIQRLQRHPYLGLFDCPDANLSADERPQSTVPSQALYFLNNPFPQEQAAHFARKLAGSHPSSHDRVQHGIELAWNRPPSKAEVQQFLQYIARYRAELAHSNPSSEGELIEPWISFARILLSANEFTYVQ